jgi:sporulation protein YlmC with PRC-barrel domain
MTARNAGPRVADLPPGLGQHRFLFFSALLRRPVCKGKITDSLGKAADLVFAHKEPYPEAVGIFIEHGWGNPTEFVPWDRVQRIEDDAIFVLPPDEGEHYPPFTDQPGWILVDAHLMGRTIFDMDGRRVEVVNDVHLLEAKGRLLLVHVDTSFNGFLRRWHLGFLRWFKNDFISWKYVQPLSQEDAIATDAVSLSVTRRELAELPAEDLADALEELTGREQEAFFGALDPETAAETLMEAEPRARRQLIEDLRKERARAILSELTMPQLANLLSVLPHDDASEMLELLPPDMARRVGALLSEQEALARDLVDQDYLAFAPDARVGEVLVRIRLSGREVRAISYVYVVGEDGKTLKGVVDLRELVLANDAQPLSDVMTSPAIAAEDDDTQEDLVALFHKYRYRMMPVTDADDRLLGVVRYNDLMKGPAA